MTAAKSRHSVTVRTRIRVEQAIARGWSFGQIADKLNVPLQTVLAVWADMDELARA